MSSREAITEETAEVRRDLRDSMFECVRRAASVGGKEMKDRGEEAGLEGMLHTARVCELGDYRVIGENWAEGAEEELGAKV